MATRDRVERGQSPEDAGRVARREFGNVSLIREVTRDQWRWRWLDAFLQDLRYSLRTLRNTPAFTCIAVLMLAASIGSNTAVFSLIDALLLRSLAVPDPQELVQISFGPPGIAGSLSGPIFDRIRERQSAFTDIFSWKNAPMVLTENGVARPIQAAYVTGSAFPTLKLKPRLGRLLEWRDDELRGAGDGFAAVISEAFWVEHFGGRTDVLGQTVIVNGNIATIVGVMPRSFNGITVDYAPQVVLPQAFDVAVRGKSSGRFDPAMRWLSGMARLKPGVSFAQAQANLATIADGVLKDALPANYQRDEYLREGRLSLSPGRTGHSPLGKIYGRSLWTLQALVGLLLLICCANLAGLQFSRSLNRHRELVVRSALGAGRLRLMQQLFTESVIIAIAGAAAGILLSQWMSSLLVSYIEQSDFPVFLALRPTSAILGWTIALTALAAILPGALPALALTRFNAEAILRAGAQRPTAWQGQQLGRVLMPLQLALSLLLVSTALVFAVSTGKLLRIDPGFRVKGITLFGVDFDRRPETGEALLELYQKMLAALRSAPGVEAASLSAVRPLSGGGVDQSAAAVEGNGPEHKHLFKNVVGPAYFATAGTKVLAGREFSEFARSGAPFVCLVNRAAANFFFAGQNALGKHIRSTEPMALQPACEIIGVVTNAKYLSLREPVPPTIYYSYEQIPKFERAGFITRSRDTATAVTAFTDALHRVAPDTPLLPAITMQRQVEDSVGQERLLAALSLFFGVVALLLTCIGLYGLEAQRVTQRTAEIGLRVALGAQRREVLWFILREASLFFAIGVPTGLALAAVPFRFFQNLLFDSSALDPRTLAAAVLSMVAVGFVAAYLPARRATRIDPMVALRYE